MVLVVEICNWPTAKIHSTSRLVFFFNLNLFKFGCKFTSWWNEIITSLRIPRGKFRSLPSIETIKETLLTRKYTSIAVLLTVLPGNVYKLVVQLKNNGQFINLPSVAMRRKKKHYMKIPKVVDLLLHKLLLRSYPILFYFTLYIHISIH